jgi:hypothetical protein
MLAALAVRTNFMTFRLSKGLAYGALAQRMKRGADSPEGLIFP